MRSNKYIPRLYQNGAPVNNVPPVSNYSQVEAGRQAQIAADREATLTDEEVIQRHRANVAMQQQKYGTGNTMAGAQNMLRTMAPGEPMQTPIPRGQPYNPANDPAVIQNYNQGQVRPDTITTNPGNAGVVRFGDPQQPSISQRMMEDVTSRNPQQAQQQQQAQPSNTKARFEAAFKEARANGETEFPFDSGNGTSMYSTRYGEETPDQHMQNMRKSQPSQTSQASADGSRLLEDGEGVKRVSEGGSKVVLLATKNAEGVMTPTEAGRQDAGFMGTTQTTRAPRQNTEPLFNDPSGSFPQNDPELSGGIPGRKINPATQQPFTNQELARSQEISKQMNYSGDPNLLMNDVQSGKVDPSQLSRYGYSNIADLREEIRLRSMPESNDQYFNSEEKRTLRRTGIDDLEKTIGNISTRFEAGNVTEGVRGIVSNGLTTQKGDKLNGFKSMGQDQMNRVKNRLSRRGQRDASSAAVLNILNGKMNDPESIIEALEGSKFDVTDMNGIELIDSTSGIRIDGSKQYVEDVFSGPGFTLTVTDDFIVGVVNGKEVKIPRDSAV